MSTETDLNHIIPYLTEFRLIIEIVLSHLRTISILSAIITIILHLIYYKMKGWPVELKAILAKAASGFAVPTGIALLICSFDLSLLSYIDDLSLYILLSSIAILYITATVLFPAGRTGMPRNAIVEKGMVQNKSSKGENGDRPSR